jgi:hypothetical protein
MEEERRVRDRSQESGARESPSKRAYSDQQTVFQTVLVDTEGEELILGAIGELNLLARNRLSRDGQGGAGAAVMEAFQELSGESAGISDSVSKLHQQHHNIRLTDPKCGDREKLYEEE